jgi:hypothetical protein
MKNPVITVASRLDPTERTGALDQVKKDLIIVLVNQGASRREAAAFVKCHHTTIGRTAARDPKFAAKLSQVEMAASLGANGLIRRASEDPKYWRAAAWMLERRNPEDYAKRSPHTFTADQVVSLLASVCSAALPTVQPEKVEEFYKFFDDAFDEVEEKAGPADKARMTGAKEDKKDAECNPAASHNGLAVNGATPSRNGHHPPQTPPAPEMAAVAPEPPAAPPEAASVRWPSEGVKDGVGTVSCDATTETLADETGTSSFEEDATADGEFDDEFDEELGGDDDDDLNIDWDRVDELHDAECRYVSADIEPNPVKRRAADRLVRLELARQQLLRESKRKYVHHPLDRLASDMNRDLTRKALASIELQRQTKSCTSGEQTKGRCTSGAESEGCEAAPAATAAAANG